ncbi:MAG: LytR C-terminal domain-containing protein, partial [Pseudomonadota bacterium]
QAQKNLALVAKNLPAEDLTQSNVSTISQPSVESDGFVINNDAEPSKTSSPSIESKVVNDNIIVPETKSETKMIQTASSVYELSTEPQTTVVAKTEATDIASHSSKANLAADKPKNILAVISGGISFKHAPVISKLFDLANNSVANFNISDNSKFVEIINGNGIKGIAKAVASKFESSGNVQLKVADAKRFNQMKTHIQYKSGHRDDAVNLNHNLLNKPYLVRNDNLPNDVALRLVLGRDLIQGASLSVMMEMEEDKESDLAS